VSIRDRRVGPSSLTLVDRDLFLFTWWIYVGTTSAGARSRSWAVRLSIAATLTALTRPDGLLAVAATPLLLVAANADSILRAPEFCGGVFGWYGEAFYSAPIDRCGHGFYRDL
jgi:hypothetical protein